MAELEAQVAAAEDRASGPASAGPGGSLVRPGPRSPASSSSLSNGSWPRKRLGRGK